jgi:hypothetical protein
MVINAQRSVLKQHLEYVYELKITYMYAQTVKTV